MNTSASMLLQVLKVPLLNLDTSLHFQKDILEVTFLESIPEGVLLFVVLTKTSYLELTPYFGSQSLIFNNLILFKGQLHLIF